MNAVNGSLIDLIGQTPMLKVNTFDTGPCELYLKLENQNSVDLLKIELGSQLFRKQKNPVSYFLAEL